MLHAMSEGIRRFLMGKLLAPARSTEALSEWSKSEVPACIEYPGDVNAISIRSEKHDVAVHGK